MKNPWVLCAILGFVLAGCSDDTGSGGNGSVTCGNSVVEAGEKCDDGNVVSGDGCKADCSEVESGYECPEIGGACKKKDGEAPAGSICGDGRVTGDEACDDDNAVSGDGCSSSCQVEAGYVCAIEGKACERKVCDTACKIGEKCEVDHCKPICEAEATFCDDTCYDLERDDAHCGQCDRKCEESQRCVESECKSICNDGLSFCNGECYDLKNDAMHCGECGKACNEDEKCSNGGCVPICESGATYCGGECGHLANDVKHCGTCDHACDEGEVCRGGQCHIDCGDMVVCSNTCVDGATDVHHCGARGRCASIADSSADFQGLDCSTLPHAGMSSCKAAACELVCDPGFADCDGDPKNGCEADLSEPENCGTCGHACSAVLASGVKCEAGTCIPTCYEGHDACGTEQCVSLRTSEHCGGCDIKCGEDETCSVDGKCLLSKCDADGYTTIKTEEGEFRAFCLSTGAEFHAFRDAVNNGVAYPEGNSDNAFVLIADIMLEDEGKNWVPVGGIDHPFTGRFFGNSRRIYSSQIFECKSNYCGLFGRVKGTEEDPAVIEGIQAELRYVAPNNYVGIIAGSVENTHVRNCNVAGTVNTDREAGGVIGSIVNSTVADCHVDATVEVDRTSAGGFAGYIKGSTIIRSTAKGSVKGKHAVGGFVGYAMDTTFADSGAVAEVDLSLSEETVDIYGMGGFVGVSDGSLYEKCHAEGDVKGIAHTGGFMGRAINDNSMKKCAAGGSVSSGEGGHAGGLVGGFYAGKWKNLVMEDVYSISRVSGGTYAGGILGETLMGTTTLTNVMHYGDLAEAANAGYLVGNQDAEAKMSAQRAYGLLGSASQALAAGKGFETGSVYDSLKVSGSSFVKSNDEKLENGVGWTVKKCRIMQNEGGTLKEMEVDTPVLQDVVLSACSGK